LVYHEARPETLRHYQTLNLPCMGLARAAGCVARNDDAAPLITDLSRDKRQITALNLSGSPGRVRAKITLFAPVVRPVRRAASRSYRHARGVLP
jgi:hypothetical protein